MFAQQQIALALRKERLTVLADQQRGEVALLGERLKKPCALADKVMDAGRYVKAHPWMAGVAVGATVLMGRRHLFRMAGFAWSAWRAWRVVDGFARQPGFIKTFKNK